MIFKKFHPRARSSGPQAFTLVELLVSLAVLSILVAILAQVVTLTSQAIDINSRKLDATGQARLFFDRLGADLAARPQRTDLGMILSNANGNDTIQFYTAANGYGAAASRRQISFVSYGIGAPPSGTGPDCLIRESDGTDWTPAGTTAVSFLAPPSFTPMALKPANSNSDVLANGIFRMEFCYLLKNGANAGTFTIALKPGEQYSAIVVGVAALDHKSLNLLTNKEVTTLAGYFHDTQDGSTPLSDWTTAMAANGFGPGIPRRVIQDIHLFQRTFYVP
jgi:prepilin-type N-terminal cleavage/methylation domain-containing protein